MIFLSIPCRPHMLANLQFYLIRSSSRADLGFSRGVGRIFKNFVRKLCRTFFKSTKLICWALLNYCKDPILTKFSAPFLGTFWKILTKNRAFFGVRSPLKLRYWRPRCLKKNFRVRHQKWISENSTKGGPFGSAGGQVPDSPIPPPLYPLVSIIMKVSKSQKFFLNRICTTQGTYHLLFFLIR